MGAEPTTVAQKHWLYSPIYPSHWHRRPLYDLARWVNGLAFRNIHFTASGKPVIKIAEIKGGISGQTRFTEQAYHETVLVRPGDLLFAWSGQPETSIDAFWWRGPEGWLNQHVFRVTPVEGVDPTFFYYLLKHLKVNFIGIARNKQTTGLGHVTKRDLQRIMAATPPLPEQGAIAHILGALDNKIDLNRRMNETLEAMARALFKSWFVDFDPVRAKMEGYDTGLPSNVAALFPDRLVQSDVGAIPEDWAVGTVRDIANLNPESWTSRNAPTSVVYVDLASTKWGRIEQVSQYRWNEAPSRARRVLRRGDTIIGTVRPANGSFALVYDEGLTASTGFAVLRPRLDADREFVWCSATSRRNIDRLARLADGGAYPAVRPDAVAESPTVLATQPVREAFSALSRGMVDQIGLALSQRDYLTRLRDLLLPKLISGEIRVFQAQETVAAIS